MDEQFEILRRKKAALSSSSRRSSVELTGSGTGDVKIIDNKRPVTGRDTSSMEERFPRPKHLSPPGSSGANGLRVRSNLVETAPPPPYYAGKERPGGAKKNIIRHAELHSQYAERLCEI